MKSRLFENDLSEIRQKIMSLSKIHSMKIIRRRVKDVVTQNHLGSPWKGEVLFDKEEAPEFIAISSESSPGRFIKVDAAVGSIRESSLVVPDLASHEGIRFFTGMDKAMQFLTDGQYEYGVEISIEDGTIAYLKRRLEKLSACRHKLHRYLVEGSKPGMTRYVIGRGINPHLDNSHVEGREQRNTSGDYDPLTNRFTKNFKNVVDASPEFQEASTECISTYIEGLQLVTNALTSKGSSSGAQHIDPQTPTVKRFDANEMIDVLQNFLSPVSGNPQGVMVVVE